MSDLITPAAKDDTRSQSARMGEDTSRQGPGLPGATATRGAQPPSPQVRRCGYCHKRIHQQRNGAWYHDHNASVSCKPGEGTGRKAWPL